jgi:hypothetical protein
LIREYMLEICCSAFNIRGRGDFAPGAAVAAGAAEKTTFIDEPISFSTTTHDAANPISEAVAANLAGGTQALTLGDLMHAMLDPLPSNATAETLRSTPTAKVMAEAARPLFSAFGPLLSAATGGLGQRGTANAANAAQMRAMRTELDSLRATVTAQQTALDALRQAPPQTRG